MISHLKITLRSLKLMAVVIMCASLVSIVTPSSPVSAACYGTDQVSVGDDRYDASLEDYQRGFIENNGSRINIPADQNCYRQNYDSLSAEAKQWVGGYNGYMQSVEDCENTDGSVSGAACANAIVSCTQYSLGWQDKCGNTAEKGLVDQIAENCHENGYYGQVDADNRCNIIGQANADELTAVEDELKENFNCNQDNIDEANGCRAMYEQAIIACAQQYGISTNSTGRVPVNQGSNNEYGHTNLDGMTQQQYKDCIYDKTRDNVNNEALCKDVGGIWQPGAGGGDCKDKLEDVTNKESCEANGGRWIGGIDGAQAPRCAPPLPPDPCQQYQGNIDQYNACKEGLAGGDCEKYTDPAQKDACNKGKKENPDGEAKGPTQNLNRVQTRCGEARVNIFICGDTPGATALNNVLRIALITLSFAVGIAAIGGLAWASVLYAKAQDNESNVSEAKVLIRNVVIGLLLYVFLMALVNWLIPSAVIT